MNQFEVIKKSLLQKKELFEDVDFPPNSTSLGQINVKGKIVWKRPKEIVSNAQFIVNKTTRIDLIQGDLSDCWFISAAACLAAEDESMLEKCVPSAQSFDEEYAGIFRFCFWNFGSWCDIIIDDRLPCVDGRLVFAHNEEEPNEFWVPLFEKAYAKLKGRYSDLDGGQTTYALVDFTGGISERIDLKEKRLLSGKLFESMMLMTHKSSLMGCEIPNKMGGSEVKLGSGLYSGHAYSITKITSVNTKYGGRAIKLLRIRNPWGQGEWNGDWSDSSLKWDILADEIRNDLLLKRENGEFWMSYEDWLSNFEFLTICHLDPSCITAELEEKHKDKSGWETQSFHAEWIRGYNAGGSSMYSFKRDKFFSNPQFKISLNALPGDKQANDKAMCHVIISLMQLIKSWDEQTIISFDIYQVRNGVAEPDNRNYNANELLFVKKGPNPTNLREVTGHYELPPGEYIVIPFTFQSEINAKFYLRVFTEFESDGGSEVPTAVIPPRPQPTIEKDRFKTIATSHFKREKADRKDLDDRELLKVLEYAFKSEKIPNGFSSLEAARCLVTMFGKSQPGVLNLEEFCNLWREIGVWIEKFITFDADRSGTIECEELNKVYASIGIQLNNEVLNALVSKYGGRNKKITADEFILCSSKIKNTYDYFKKLSGERKLRMNLEEWMSMTLTF